MYDRHTRGGYTQNANMVSKDLPDDKINFEEVKLKLIQRK
jgi:hypothetical protein